MSPRFALYSFAGALLLSASRDVRVSLSMSIGLLDQPLWRSVEAGTPSPARRLDAVRTLADSGLGCSVLIAPLSPSVVRR